jgi:hypothetical protein
MGLDVSHDCWHGAYSAFGTWRTKLAELAGIPLPLMEGFYEPPRGFPGAQARDELLENIIYGTGVHKYLPLSWDILKPDPLHVLLNHSDCEGEIRYGMLRPLADRLESLLPLLPTEPHWGHIGNWQEKTQKFIDGLRLAAERHENVRFH